MGLLEAISRAGLMAFSMFWEIWWALVLGFLLSACVQAVVSKKEMKRLLPSSSPLVLIKACGLGAASSSCSYAAAAISRTLFRKGADFTASIAFEFASTNLVVELGLLLVLLLGWQFMAAELVGGILMVFILSLLFRLALPKELIDEARAQSERGLPGKMEGHAAMDMSVEGSSGGMLRRLMSANGFTSVSHIFFMETSAIWKDIFFGIAISGCLAAWVPNTFWQGFFLAHRSGLGPVLWGAAIGPIVSMLSFVCSIGNVPLAALLWRGGISFGGVVSFIFADLLILPILNIYRKYYGLKMAIFLAATSYVAMVLAGLVVELLFSLAGIVPHSHQVLGSFDQGPRWNYTSLLNAAFLLLVGILGLRFVRTGGQKMMAMMEHPTEGGEPTACH